MEIIWVLLLSVCTSQKCVTQEVKEFLLGADFSDRQFRAEFGSEAEYPQIAIGLKHRGTLKETLKYMSDNEMFS